MQKFRKVRKNYSGKKPFVVTKEIGKALVTVMTKYHNNVWEAEMFLQAEWLRYLRGEQGVRNGTQNQTMRGISGVSRKPDQRRQK